MRTAITIALWSLAAFAAEDHRIQDTLDESRQKQQAITRQIDEQTTVARDLADLTRKYPGNAEYSIRHHDASMRLELLKRARAEERASNAAKLAALAEEYANKAAETKRVPVLPDRLKAIDAYLEKLRKQASTFESMAERNDPPEAKEWLQRTRDQIRNLEATKAELERAMEAEKAQIAQQTQEQKEFTAEKIHQQVEENGHRVEALGHGVTATIHFTKLLHAAGEQKHCKELLALRGQRPAAAPVTISEAGGQK